MFEAHNSLLRVPGGCMYAPKSRSRKSTALCLSHHQHPERVGLEVAKCSPTLVQLPALFSTFSPSYNSSIYNPYLHVRLSNVTPSVAIVWPISPGANTQGRPTSPNLKSTDFGHIPRVNARIALARSALFHPTINAIILVNTASSTL